MVLERLFSSSNQKEVDSFEFDDPKALRSDGYDDCLSCRVVGSTALVSLGGYTYYTGMKNLKAQRKVIEMSKSKYKYGSRQLGILTLSATLVGMGLYRTFN